MTLLGQVQPPRWPDTLVFGPQLPDGVEVRIPARLDWPHRWCDVCGVEWYGVTACFACEGAT